MLALSIVTSLPSKLRPKNKLKLIIINKITLLTKEKHNLIKKDIQNNFRCLLGNNKYIVQNFAKNQLKYLNKY